MKISEGCREYILIIYVKTEATPPFSKFSSLILIIPELHHSLFMTSIFFDVGNYSNTDPKHKILYI